MNNRYVLGLVVLGVLLVAGCMEVQMNVPSSQVEANQMEQQQQVMINNVPVPKLTKSLERENLAKRLNLLNDNNKVFYVYLVNYGKVMAFYTAQGKVSSVSSYMTPMQRIVPDGDCVQNCRGGTDCDLASCYFAVEAPDQDGSYGTNGDGVFFFTTEGAYVEWHGDYMVSDYPLKLAQPVEMVMDVTPVTVGNATKAGG